jgi:membrane fusion protein, multidrug efflux system
VLGGVPSDVRVIVAGQELISEGETVNAVEADEATIRRLVSEATGISF